MAGQLRNISVEETEEIQEERNVSGVLAEVKRLTAPLKLDHCKVLHWIDKSSENRK